MVVVARFVCEIGGDPKYCECDYANTVVPAKHDKNPKEAHKPKKVIHKIAIRRLHPFEANKCEIKFRIDINLFDPANGYGAPALGHHQKAEEHPEQNQGAIVYPLKKDG